MNLNNLFPLRDHEPYCKRAKVDTGTFCNYRCSFCYYYDKLNEKKTFEDIIKQIDYLIECGIKEIDLSGGESTIHEDWFSILDYCNTKGLYISTVSNGFMFNSKRFMEISKNKGLKEILFSLHGYNEETHNSVVNNNYAFQRIMQAITNAKELGIIIRLNYVVNKKSVDNPDAYAKFLNEIKPLEINFLTLNYFGIANEYMSYEESTNHIKKIIDSIDIKYINVRYTPYCYMVGYEQYVCNTFQHIYDLYDWNMALYDMSLEPVIYKKDQEDCLYEQAKKDRINLYFKPNQCIQCKYLFICDGIEKQSHDSVHPERGEKIKYINHYRKDFYANKCINSNSQQTTII